MQDSRFRMQDKSPPLFTKGGQGGIIKNHVSCILYQASYVFIPFVVSLLVFLLVSCGKKEVKPVSPESKIAQEAFSLAETIRNAYIKNDRETLEKYSTKDGFTELIGAIKRFDSVELVITPTWVEIENSVVSLHVSWNGTWTVGGKRTEERGVAVFVLEGSPLKLTRVQKENPFRQPE